MKDLYNLIERKYNTGKISMEIGTLFFSDFLKDKLIDVATNNSITAKITTKNKLYKLSKGF
jgi:hypothetical protein